MTDQDRWHELIEILTNSEAEYRRMALETFADSHDPVNAFRWQQRAEGLHIALSHVRRIGRRMEDVSTLIERASLGTPDAVALRKSVDDDTASSIVARACALAGGTLGTLHLQDVLDVLNGSGRATGGHVTNPPAIGEDGCIAPKLLADVMAVPRDLLDEPHVDLMAEMRKRLPEPTNAVTEQTQLCSDKNGFHDGHYWTPDPCDPHLWCPGYPVPKAANRTCGFAFVGNVGEFTCDHYAGHEGKHRNYLAEFEWTDEVTR